MSPNSPQSAPPHIAAATEQLKLAIRNVDRRTIDEQTTPWAEIEKSVIKLLGGAFKLERGDHQAIALGLAGIYAVRLIHEQHGFWFPNREALEGASLGFADALRVVSPFGAVVEALASANLSRLDAFAKEIRRSVGQARFAGGAAGVAKLGPEDYQRIFDPGFVQFVNIDIAKAAKAWDAKPNQLTADLRDALSRAGSRISAEVRTLFEAQFISVLQHLDRAKSLKQQTERAPRVLHLMTHLFATVDASGIAPEEFWDGLVFPLLYIGAPSDFPPIEAGDLRAYRSGMDPLLLFADLIPYRTSAPEDGPLGAFAASELSLLDPTLPPAAAARLFKLDPSRLKTLLESFDPSAVRSAIQRFASYVEQKVGGSQGSSAASPMLEPALRLLSDLKRVAAGAPGQVFCMRQATEAEAALEPATAELRKAMQGPRIILL
jgi:hypothetical protein